MSVWWRNFLLLVKKESLSCYRDPDVFIYSVVLPLVFWPLLIFSISEFFIWRAGAHEHMKIQVAYDTSSPVVASIRETLKKNKFVTESTVPFDRRLPAIRSHEIDAFIFSNKKGKILIDTSSSNPEYETISAELAEAMESLQENNLQKALTDKGAPRNLVEVFKIDQTDLAPSTAPTTDGKGAPLGSFRTIIYALLSLAFSSIAFGIMAPALAIFTEEREKGTIGTTLMLPVNRSTIVFAKIATMTAVGLASGAINLVSLTAATTVIASQLKLQLFVNFPTIVADTSAPIVLLSVPAAMILYSLCGSAVLSLCSAPTSDYAQAYNILGLPVIWMGAVPFFCIFPTLHLDHILSLVPFLNLCLLVKDAVHQQLTLIPSIVTVLESVLIIVICTSAVTRYLQSEKCLVGEEYRA